MKECILLVGPQGSGKTTFAKLQYPHYEYISQDEQGKEEHFKLFLHALDIKKNVIVDRMNHTQVQRRKYLEAAKNNGYKTIIIVKNEPYDICYHRIKGRKTHPTLHEQSQDMHIYQALTTYFSEYQYVQDTEADEVKRITSYDPYLLNLKDSDYTRFVIIGDVHGCFDELQEGLLKANAYDEGTAIVFLGDLIDRGPKVKEVLDFFDTLPHAYTILGNHEYKFLRYLQGRKVQLLYGLSQTINQCGFQDVNSVQAQILRRKLESLPYVIEFPFGFGVHGGINPSKSIYTQVHEAIIYTRRFNPQTHAFNEKTGKFWFEYYDENKPQIFFGHHHLFTEIEMRKNVFALDGGCVYGGDLRIAIVQKSGTTWNKKYITVRAKDKYYRDEKIPTANDFFKQADYLVLQGYLKKEELGDLVLYNYTPKTQFEQNWNEYTRQCRGIILDKNTQEIVARPFCKFFNINENEETQAIHLPAEPFEVFEKLDGSLGILFYYNNKWNIVTRGSFHSEQAKNAESMLATYNLQSLDPSFTYLLEIIYPENKIVVNYESKKALVLIGAIKNKTGDELSYAQLEQVSKATSFELMKKYTYSKISELLELSKTLSKDYEGFVVRFSSGVRIKIKGKEYLKIFNILEQLTPLAFWRTMKNGKVDEQYLQQVPEEFKKEAEGIINALELEYNQTFELLKSEFDTIPFKSQSLDDKRKELGIYLETSTAKHKMGFFHYLLAKQEHLDAYLNNCIRPKGNSLENTTEHE